MKPDDAEVARLRRALAKTRTDRDILRKAIAYFVKHPQLRRGLPSAAVYTSWPMREQARQRHFFAVAALAIALAEGASLARADEPPPFLTAWAAISNPQGIATDAAGNVYVGNGWPVHSIQKFTSTGSLLTEWGSYGAGLGQFNEPTGMAVDAFGNVYVVDQANHRIQKFSSDGVFLITWGASGSGPGQFYEPWDVKVDGYGNILVTDSGNNRVQKFTSDGAFLAQWGSWGGGVGQFARPAGLAVDGIGNVYVADRNNNRVQKFTSEGVFLTAFGSYGTGNGQFRWPIGLAVDRNDHLYVADLDNNRVQKFTRDGVFLSKWGSFGSSQGQFTHPICVAVDVAGNMYVADTGNNRIQKFGFCPVRNEKVDFEPGPGTALSDAWQSFGDPDSRGTPLGYGGRLVLRFPDGISDGTGMDLRVFELGHSYSPAIDENYRVEASFDGSTYVTLGEALGDIANFDLAAGGLSLAHYIRITDLPPNESLSIPDYDPTVVGADIDAVVALSCPRNEVNCTNGIDDDGDGLLDCEDGDCLMDMDGDNVNALPCGTDCNDANRAEHPGAAEICGNGRDEDCDGLTDCADVCSWVLVGASVPDCSLPCSDTHEFCQWFEWVGGATPDPAVNFDIVIGADKTMSPGFLPDGLTADINQIRAAFTQLPLDATAFSKISWWRCKQRVLVVRYADETAETAAYLDLLRRYHLDAAVFRSTPLVIPPSTEPSLGETKRASPPYAWYATDPTMDGAVTALHELGHAAFGLADEYDYSDCGGLPCSRRSQGYREDKVAPNVWASEADCEAKRNYYAQCNVTAPCYEFCAPGTAWRLGSDSQNPNLMRAKCPVDEPSRWDPTQGYGQIGNIRLREVLAGYVSPCFGPTLVTLEGAGLALPLDSSRRVRFRLSFTPTSISAVQIEIASGAPIPVVPTTDPIYVDVEDASGTVLADVRPWDPRVSGVHHAIADSGEIEVEMPLPADAKTWSIRSGDGVLLAHGSLGQALLDYCRANNFIDAECWTSEGPVAVHLGVAPKTIRLLPVWPNPARDRVYLRLDMPWRETVSIRIFDLAGRRLRTLREGTFEPGMHTLEWDARDDDGRALSPGAYFCAVNTGRDRLRRTIIIVR